MRQPHTTDGYDRNTRNHLSLQVDNNNDTTTTPHERRAPPLSSGGGATTTSADVMMGLRSPLSSGSHDQYDIESPAPPVTEERQQQQQQQHDLQYTSYISNTISPLMERSLLDETPTPALDVPFVTRRRRRGRGNTSSRSSTTTTTSRFDEHSSTSMGLAKMQEEQEPRRYSAPAPPISNFLLADDAYRDLLLGHRQKKGLLDGLEHVNDLDVATGCAWFSGVGMAFLLFIGLLIEKQPLYIKGIKPRRQGNSYGETMRRQVIANQMRNGKAVDGGNFGQDEYDILGSADMYGNRMSSPKMGRSRSEWESGENKYGNANHDYAMSTEASSAFKAAAAYFLTLVLSLTYIQTHDRIKMNLRSMMITPAQVRYYSLSIYRKYRRRQYINIPDTCSTTPDIHVYTEPSANMYQHGRPHGIWGTVANIKGKVLGRRERGKSARLKKRR